MRVLGFIVFIIVQIAFIPLAIIGIIIVAYKQMYISKKLGVSSTAIKVINGRWTMDKFGLRKDNAAVKLSNVLPNNSTFGLWLVHFPLYLQYKITGKNIWYPIFKEEGTETLADIITSRTVFFDQIIKKAQKEAAQFVVMGAGFDTRCYGDLGKSDIRLFELDQAKTQKLKIDYLNIANIDTSYVQYVEVDFSHEHWYDKLEKAGFDQSKKTIFLWEGVTLYLSEKDVRNSIKDIKEHTVPGSILVADFYAESFVKGELFPGMKKGIEALKITDEEFDFGIDFSKNPKKVMESFLATEQVKLNQLHCMGSKTSKGTWMVVAEIIF